MKNLAPNMRSGDPLSAQIDVLRSKLGRSLQDSLLRGIIELTIDHAFSAGDLPEVTRYPWTEGNAKIALQAAISADKFQPLRMPISFLRLIALNVFATALLEAAELASEAAKPALPGSMGAKTLIAMRAENLLGEVTAFIALQPFLGLDGKETARVENALVQARKDLCKLRRVVLERACETGDFLRALRWIANVHTGLSDDFRQPDYHLKLIASDIADRLKLIASEVLVPICERATTTLQKGGDGTMDVAAACSAYSDVHFLGQLHTSIEAVYGRETAEIDVLEAGDVSEDKIAYAQEAFDVLPHVHNAQRALVTQNAASAEKALSAIVSSFEGRVVSSAHPKSATGFNLLVREFVRFGFVKNIGEGARFLRTLNGLASLDERRRAVECLERICKCNAKDIEKPFAALEKILCRHSLRNAWLFDGIHDAAGDVSSPFSSDLLQSACAELHEDVRARLIGRLDKVVWAHGFSNDCRNLAKSIRGHLQTETALRVGIAGPSQSVGEKRKREFQLEHH